MSTVFAEGLVEGIQELLHVLAQNPSLQDPEIQKRLIKLIKSDDFIAVFSAPVRTLKIALALANDEEATESYYEAVQDWIDSL